MASPLPCIRFRWAIALAVVAAIAGHRAPAAAATIVVDSIADVAADDGACTLREAITAANLNAASGAMAGECAAGDAGTDDIAFALGAGTPSIAPLAPLPTITEPVHLDGGTGGSTRVELDGSSAGMATGLQVTGGDSLLRSLVVNRFAQSGIALVSAGNRVEDCLVGTDASGTVDLGNGADGIVVQLGGGNTIGGSDPGTGNVVSGNAARGIEIALGSTGNTVAGNLVGTDASGAADLGNGDFGILLFTADNAIGGTAAAARNVISGNGTAGVRIDGAGATGNVVAGNFIGTNAAGTAAIGNTQDGVLIAYSASGNTIGGSAAGAGNVISGNGFRGVSISADATGNFVRGNLVGTSASGTAAVGNLLDGIALFAPGNTVGGVAPGEGNVVSGNGLPSGSGIYVDALGGSSIIQGNLVGTDASGTAAIPNAFNGVQIRASGNLVGGDAPGAGNLVSGNLTTGVFLTASGTGNVVAGNRIGTALDGVTPLGNARDGVTLGSTTTGPASGNTIGGTTAAAGNTIAYNGRDGVRVTGGTGNAIRGNGIFSNAGLGIDLGGNGVTANDAGPPPDADAGANDLQNFPVLSAASSTPAKTEVSGALASTPSTAFTVELFASPACDGTHGEGRTFLGSIAVSTDASGAGSFAATLPVPAGVGGVVTATATGPGGSTSELSACVAVEAGVVELCSNCIDDDGDGLADRGDPDCPPPADGGNQGLADLARAKRLDKCGKAIQTAGAAYLKSRLGRVRKCTDLATACVQQKPGDAKCLPRATASCAKSMALLPADAAKLGAAVRKACSPPNLSADDLRDARGLGYDAEVAACAEVGAGAPADVDSIAACIALRHACRSDELLGLEVPRAAELLALVGRTPATELPCLGAGSDGGGAGVGDKTRARLAVACGKAIGKAGATFVAGKRKIADNCVRALTKCVQTDPGDAGCLAKARAKCAKELAKLSAARTGLEPKLVASIEKACTKDGLPFADVVGASGLGFAGHAAHCADLGVAGLATAGDVAECVRRQHECRAEQLLEAEIPRLRELISLGGTPFP